MTERIGNWCQTVSGEKVYFIDHRKGDITEQLVKDAVYAVSNMPRFAGHVRPAYYVGQHMIDLSSLVSPQNALWALVHDLHEGMGWVDVPYPLKEHLPNYRALEESFQEIVADYFNLEWPMPKEVKKLDRLLCITEAEQLMKKINWGGSGSGESETGKGLDFVIHPMTPTTVEGLWWYRYEEIMRGE